MPQLNLHIKYQKKASQVISASEIRKNFLFGIDLTKYGKTIDDSVFNFWIEAATTQLEDYLSIKLNKQIITETRDFWRSEWTEWSFIPVTYPVIKPVKLRGYLGTVKQVDFPDTWLSSRSTSDGKTYRRQLFLVPNANSSQTDLVTFSGIMPNLGYWGNLQIPNYWTISYITGMDLIPQDLLVVIGKLATIQIMAVASDALLPHPGVSSQSISLDGLSQSVSGFANSQSGVFGARIKQYTDDLWGVQNKPGELKRLRDLYVGPLIRSL